MLTIWHNPRCSKSRQTLARIEAAGQAVTIRRYLETPPSASEITAVLGLLGLTHPRDITRVKDAAFKAVPNTAEMAAAQWTALLAANPALIERPIVSDGTRAVMGRPPENVDVLL